MSSNLDLVRSIYADWERGDFSSAVWADPEIEYVRHDWLSPGSSKGLVGMAEGFRNFLNAWEGLRVAPVEYRELDDERVLVLVNLGGRGKTSGLELGQMRTKGAHVFQVRNGKVTRLVQYLDREHAFADLDLAAEGDSADAPD